ncbi:hypothetical protein [Alcaligenes endophyticus]|uniref:Recombinase RecT n=1 Tax=Alcaligenes endophyticus TaxID=1929088 RepID=A0ABT8EIV0_9BURK|nr:hypothetical protein [Alcaligenes endophyticus]MCX5592490.1 hypothetical protein [Alcaligenes endophyticus]MDN4121215.1 hypothetical protein [Alcaligenes endophyticus]
MADLTTHQKQGFSLTPQSLDEALRFADVLAKSSIVPKDFAGNPGNILVAIQWGLELGLQPMQAMQSIAVINGRPALWGDAVIALVRSSSVCEYIYETDDGNTATIRVKRRGEEEQVRTFSTEDAKSAGLAGKPGPWSQYPKRMRQMRARAFALRDVFPDVLRGMPIAEEVQDTPLEKDMGRAQTTAQAQAALPHYPQESLEENLGKWRGMIESGRVTPERVIANVESKFVLSDLQKKSITDLAKPELIEAE